MPEKFKQKLLFIVINAVCSLVVMFIILAFTARGEKFLRTEKAIESKAEIEYVDKHDEDILNVFESYRTDHAIQHSTEFKAIQGQLDILVKWVESERRGD